MQDTQAASGPVEKHIAGSPAGQTAPQWRGVPALWSAAVFLGVLQAWASRTVMHQDMISYLDLSSALLRHEWRTAISAHWSPLYPVLLSLAMGVLKPPPYFEFAVLHLVDFLTYLGALACFHFFLRQLVRYHRIRFSGLGGDATLPEWSWWVLGYALFIWSSLVLILKPTGTPDMCVAAFVYLAAGILVRLRAGLSGWGAFAALGAALGFGYLSKAAMFPMAFVFFAVGVLAVGNLRRAATGALLALLAFSLVGGPFLIALSKTRGRWTFSDAGKLSYAWMVERIPFVHWQGDPVHGTPIHPTRKISDRPAVYEFATPIRGAYPPWYDPGYWNEGPLIHFRAAEQARALILNAKSYLNLFLRQGGLIVGFLALCFLSRRRCVKDIAGQWALLIPAAAALFMYWLVYVEWRYVGAFLVLLWLGLFSGLRLPGTAEMRRAASCVVVAIAVLLMADAAAQTAQDFYFAPRSWTARPPAWPAAEALHRLGVEPGDSVALIGSGFDAFWARLARVRIVAQVPPDQADFFWTAGDMARGQAIAAIASSGAKAIVADFMPPFASTTGWQRLADTGYYVYLLKGT